MFLDHVQNDPKTCGKGRRFFLLLHLNPILRHNFTNIQLIQGTAPISGEIASKVLSQNVKAVALIYGNLDAAQQRAHL